MEKKVTPRGRGRPRLPDADRRSGRIEIKVSPAEQVELERAAEQEGIGVGTWMRERSLRAARRRS